MSQRQQTIFTPRVIQARRELLAALSESVKQADFAPEAIEGKVSAVLSEIWSEADKIAKAIPLSDESDGRVQRWAAYRQAADNFQSLEQADEIAQASPFEDGVSQVLTNNQEK
jgi:hypothetical protein